MTAFTVTIESLNMSKLNVSAAVSSSTEEAPRPSTTTVNVKQDLNYLTDPDNEYYNEYREDIWKSLLEQEAEKPPIHLQSPQLEFRGTLVQQLRDVTKKLDLSLATLHSAVAQLDLFMDAHRLRGDRLTHVALACLSLAAKSEEKKSRAPTLKTLSKISGIQLCGKTFKQLELMVGQHVRWRLLAPTPVTFAALLAPLVVTDADLTTRHPKFVRRFKRDGAKLLDAYLDLTLSDVRLKVVDSVDVGCACVACARADLGLCAWPPALIKASGRQYTSVAPISRLLQRMMHILKSRESNVDSEVDQGYSSARTSPNLTPNLTPCASPSHVSPATSCSSSTSCVDNSYRHRPIEQAEYSVLDLNDTVPPPPPMQYPPAIDTTERHFHRADHAEDHRYYRASRLLEASLDAQPSTSMVVKRGLDPVEYEKKRYKWFYD
ncbi:cyclin-J [Pectinophora gossypiella]|nr:cyclin-J [Pectinophora gossypiella]